MTIFYIFLAVVVIVSLFTGLIVSIVEKKTLGNNHVIVNEVVKTVVVPKEVEKEVIKEVPVEVIREVEKEVPITIFREVEKVPDPLYDGATKVFDKILPISDELRSTVKIEEVEELEDSEVKPIAESMNKVVIDNDEYNIPRITSSVIVDEELIWKYLSI